MIISTFFFLSPIVFVCDAKAAEMTSQWANFRPCLDRMIEIMRVMGEGDHGSEVARTRVQVLAEFL